MALSWRIVDVEARRMTPLAERDGWPGGGLGGAVAPVPDGTPELSDAFLRLDAIVGSVTDPYVLGDPVRDGSGQIVDFVVRAANQAAIADIGQSHRTLVGGRASALFPTEFGVRIISMVAEVLDTGAPLGIDEYLYPSRRSGGALRRYDIRASAVGTGWSSPGGM